MAWFNSYNLLTAKPVIFAANVAEDDLADDGASNEKVAQVRKFAEEENSEAFVICAQIEQEISELDEDEKAMFWRIGAFGVRPGELIKASYHILGLMSFLTAGGGRDPGMDHQNRYQSATGGWQDPLRFREGLHQGRSGEL